MKDKTYHPAPEWLTTEYLECVLRIYKKDNELSIKTLNITAATANGENYASIMTRIKVEFTLSNSKDVLQGSYIAKTSYENDPYISAIMQPYDPYKTEMLMYEKILPQLNQLLRDAGDEDKLAPETIYVDYEHSAIIFEDLAVSNYVIADRLAGMDEVHTKLALKKLAKMHAAAAVFNERTPGILEKLKRGIFNRYTRGFSPMFENLIEVAANYAGDCIELGAYYKKKLLHLKSHVVENAIRAHDQHEGHFHTLTHGDFWINNIMLSYCNNAKTINNGIRTIKDLLLIDFQFCNWSSPALDLHYFFNTSLTAELRFEKQDELIQYYHGVLVEALRKLEYRGHIPTLHEFSVQMEAGRFYAVTSSLCVQPVMINDKTDDADFNSLMKTDERAQNFRKLLYTNKKIQEYVKIVLPVFDRKGLLDVTD